MQRQAYRDKNAVCVLGFPRLVGANDTGEALDVVHPHDVDVVVEAEGLDEREVDLERDVALILLVGCQHAESHAVRITVGEEQ